MSYQMTPNKYLKPTELEALQRLLAKDLSRDSIMLQLALATGARATELVSIALPDLDREEQTVTIHGLKGSLDRTLPLKPELFAKLWQLAKASPDGRPFPIGYDRLEDIWHLWRPVKKKFHSLRHTFAIELYKRTRDIKLVQRALGHKSINSTMVYVDLVYTTEEFRKAML